MKKLLKKFGVAVLSLGVLASAATYTACNFFEKEDPTEDQNPITVVVDDPDPEENPSQSGIIDPEEENPSSSEPEEPVDENPSPSEPEEPVDENPSPSEPEEPVDDQGENSGGSLPTLDELAAEKDKIYGRVLNDAETNFVGDEPVFKSDELYDVVMERFEESVAPGIIDTNFIDGVFANYSEYQLFYSNYDYDKELYTLAYLCEYSNTSRDNNKCLRILEIPMDLSENSFSALRTQLQDLLPKNIDTYSYDYRISNIDYDEDYLPSTSNVNIKSFIDACILAAYRDTTVPDNVLILLEDYEFSAGAHNLGANAVINVILVELNDDDITIKNKIIYAAEGDTWFGVTLVNHYDDDSYVVVVNGVKDTVTMAYDQFAYDADIYNAIVAAQPTKSSSYSANQKSL